MRGRRAPHTCPPTWGPQCSRDPVALAAPRVWPDRGLVTPVPGYCGLGHISSFICPWRDCACTGAWAVSRCGCVCGRAPELFLVQVSARTLLCGRRPRGPGLSHVPRRRPPSALTPSPAPPPAARICAPESAGADGTALSCVSGPFHSPDVLRGGACVRVAFLSEAESPPAMAGPHVLYRRPVVDSSCRGPRCRDRGAPTLPPSQGPLVAVCGVRLRSLSGCATVP